VIQASPWILKRTQTKKLLTKDINFLNQIQNQKKQPHETSSQAIETEKFNLKEETFIEFT